MRRYPTLEIEEQMNALVAGYTPRTRAGGHPAACREIWTSGLFTWERFSPSSKRDVGKESEPRPSIWG